MAQQDNHTVVAFLFIAGGNIMTVTPFALIKAFQTFDFFQKIIGQTGPTKVWVLAW